MINSEKMLIVISTAMILIGLLTNPVFSAERKHNEAFFCDIVAVELNGTSEVKTKYNKRIDILTDDVAWECDWTTKPYEAIGQALAYGQFEGLRPGIVFFHDTSKKRHELTYQMMHELADTYGITLRYYETNKLSGAITHTETYN